MPDIPYECKDCLLGFHGDCGDPHCDCCRGMAPVVGDERLVEGLYDDEYSQDAA